MKKKENTIIDIIVQIVIQNGLATRKMRKMRNKGEYVIIELDNNEEVKGYLWENERIPLDEVKKGFTRYSIRHDDEGRAATLETFVGVNHYGDFITKKKIKMNGTVDRHRKIEGIIRNVNENKKG